MSSHFDERIIPDQTPRGILSVHLSRYHFAAPFCRSKRVLDLACGMGYGTHYLAECARSIIGVDISEEAIHFAKQKYSDSNLDFQVMDANHLSFEGGSFEVVCSFETIEHLKNVSDYLSQVARILNRKEGFYLVSSPYVKKTTHAPQNPFHFHEWSPEDFRVLLSRYFSSIRLFAQQRKQTFLHRIFQKADILKLHQRFFPHVLTHSFSRALATTPFAEMTLSDLKIVERENGFEEALSILAVCQKPR